MFHGSTILSARISPNSEQVLREAYDYCIEVTRRSARNFYYGIRLLRRERFASLCALYAFCRELDDAVDRANLQEAPQLFAARRQLIRDGHAQKSDRIELAFADTIGKYQLPQHALHELVDTIESDTAARHFETMEEVRSYAHGVASTVGLCSVRIFGIHDGGADAFAEALGIALQWTNILRDIEEDHRRGRCYLPQSELRKFGLTVEDLLTNERTEQVHLWWQAATEQGRTFFRAAGKALPPDYRRQLSPALAMAAVYRMILERMARQPARPPRLHAVQKLLCVFAALLRLWNPFR
jgi:phytoene synthase